jgi:hypothetical protein
MTLHRKHSNNNLFNDPLGARTSELNYPDPRRARLLASWEDFNLRRPHLSRLLVELFGEPSAIEVHREVNIIPESRAAGALGHLKPLKRKVRDLSNVSDS